MNDTVTVPNSIYLDGEWFTGHWAVECVDGESGELIITATVAGPGAPRVAALRMDMETVRDLRRAAGFIGPLPRSRADAAADLWYWRESVEFAVKMLERGRAEGQGPLLRAANDAERYLRQLVMMMQRVTDELGLLGPVERQLNGVRLAELERGLAELKRRMNRMDDALTGQIARAITRAEDVEDRLGGVAEKLMSVERDGAKEGQELRRRIDEIEAQVERTLERMEMYHDTQRDA